MQIHKLTSSAVITIIIISNETLLVSNFDLVNINTNNYFLSSIPKISLKENKLLK